VTPSLLGNIEFFRDFGWSVEGTERDEFVSIYLDGSFSHNAIKVTPTTMRSQPQIYSQNKPRWTQKRVNCVFTRPMSTTFGERLKEKLEEAGLTAAELARRSGVTKQNIGRILNNTPHSITGALPRVEPGTVLKLAQPLGWDVNDALLAAGHAPTDMSKFSSELNRRVSLLEKALTAPERAEMLEELDSWTSWYLAKIEQKRAKEGSADNEDDPGVGGSVETGMAYQ